MRLGQWPTSTPGANENPGPPPQIHEFRPEYDSHDTTLIVRSPAPPAPHSVRPADPGLCTEWEWRGSLGVVLSLTLPRPLG